MAATISLYGFQFTKNDGHADQFPILFDRMVKTSGSLSGPHFRYAAAELELGPKNDQWWGGIVMKFRPGKLTPFLTGAPGKEIITAEDFSGQGKILDPTFFIANRKTGRGLYSHHHGAATVGAFGTLCQGIHRLAQDERRKAIEASDAGAAEKKRALAETKGELVLEQLVSKEGFVALVRKLKRASETQFVLSTVDTKSSMFGGFLRFARREKMVFSLKDDTDVNALADEFKTLLASADGQSRLSDVRVQGVGKDGFTRRIKLASNTDKFDQFDFDSAIGDLAINFANLTDSIRNAGIIRRLYAQSQAPKTKIMLETV